MNRRDNDNIINSTVRTFSKFKKRFPRNPCALHGNYMKESSNFRIYLYNS